MSDSTEAYRRQRVAEINAEPGSREALEVQHGQVWDTARLARDFGELSSFGSQRAVGIRDRVP